MSLKTTAASPKRADAARNEQRVLDAARQVLYADRDAPMTHIAAAAGVGMGTVYRHYPSKQDLVLALCFDGLARAETLANQALSKPESDPARSLSEYMTAALDTGVGGFVHLASTFTPPPELLAAAERLRTALSKLLETAQRAGAARTDITAADLVLILEQVRAVHLSDRNRAHALERRYLALALQALLRPDGEKLPGPAPTWTDIARRWTDPSAAATADGPG
jgi:AcrR family transcriptional regulator